MDERKAFEAWAAPLRYEVHHQSNKGDYLGMATQIAWEAWQAATLAERERAAKVCDEIAETDGTGYGIAEDCAAAIRKG